MPNKRFETSTEAVAPDRPVIAGKLFNIITRWAELIALLVVARVDMALDEV
jgi:hypothetical protein